MIIPFLVGQSVVAAVYKIHLLSDPMGFIMDSIWVPLHPAWTIILDNNSIQHSRSQWNINPTTTHPNIGEPIELNQF